MQFLCGMLFILELQNSLYKISGHKILGSKNIDKNTFLIIKPIRCTNFSNLFWNVTLHVSDSSSVQHQEFFTVHTAMVYVIQVFLTCLCCVYNIKFLMMARGTVRNM